MHRILHRENRIGGSSLSAGRLACCHAPAALRLIGGLWLGWTAACSAAWDPAPSGLSTETCARVQRIYSDQLNRYKADTNQLVLPGLIADRSRQRVDVLAESTGLTSNTIVEFILISPASRHGYEALAVSCAQPSDVHKALVFIGLQPGSPYHPQQIRVWPKGERVVIRCAAGANVPVATQRIERLILDTKTGRSLPETGFVFTGSTEAPAEDGKPGREYGADVCEPQSIVSIYNDPYAVLDVPRRARQSDVYGTQVAHPERLLPEGELLTFSLEPEYKDGRKRVRDLVLEMRAAAGGAGQTNPAAAFQLCDLQGKTVAVGQHLPDLRKTLESATPSGCDLFVSVRFGRDVRLADIPVMSRLISELDDGAAMRVEPPAPGELYYRAFLADPKWQKRENRTGQPWELTVTETRGVLSGSLILVEVVGEGISEAPEFKTRETAIADAAALRRALEADADSRRKNQQQPHLPVVLVFADPALSYGRLTEFIQPVLSTHYVVYVFLRHA